MTDPIYSLSRWLIFFWCCIWHTRNCFRFCIELNVYICFTYRIHHELFYGKKSVVWHNVTSKQGKHVIVLFWTAILFNRLNVNMLFLFVCLSDCKYLIFPCISDTLAGDFLYAQLIYRGKVVVPPTLRFSRKRHEIIFRGHCRPRKLKSAKNNPHVFETKPRKFGDAKISHYTVCKEFSNLDIHLPFLLI